MTEKIIYTLKSVYREPLKIRGFVFGNESRKDICVLGSLRGNEIQQMHVCSQLVKRLKKLELQGEIAPGRGIMVIPCANYYSMNIGKRFWPMDNTDINRMFPGYDMGETTQRIADGLFKELQGFETGIQLASFYQPGRFLTHVKRMNAPFTKGGGLEDFGLPYAVEREPGPYDTATLNYNWQLWNTKAFSLYANCADDLDEKTAEEAIDAVLRYMYKNGAITCPIRPGHVTTVVGESDMTELHCPCGGLFRKKTEVGEFVGKGRKMAEIIDPLTGETLTEITSPEDAIVFFTYAAPLVPEGAVLFRLISNSRHKISQQN